LGKRGLIIFPDGTLEILDPELIRRIRNLHECHIASVERKRRANPFEIYEALSLTDLIVSIISKGITAFEIAHHLEESA
jgi:hypothetical protein